jgi:hypothetical protein
MSKILYDNIHDTVDVSDFLVPAKEALPQWFSEMKADYYAPNVRTCASFMELFDKSLIYKSPGNFQFKFVENALDSGGDCEKHIGIKSHTLFDGTDQLGNFDKGFHNIKIDSNLLIKSEKGRIDAIFMDVFYWDTRPKFRAAQGVLPILDNKEVQLNVNLWVPKFIEHVEVKKDDPIAMLYFPMGIPEFERGDISITEREHEGGNYLGKMKSCPYLYPNENKSTS